MCGVLREGLSENPLKKTFSVFLKIETQSPTPILLRGHAQIKIILFVDIFIYIYQKIIELLEIFNLLIIYKNIIIAISAAISLGGVASAQKVTYEEFNLPNGLHVILHNDSSAPVVITSVMYHVGAKNETPDRTGFAHFFEHLLFEGTKNIKRGEWFKIVTANGGTNNANTNEDQIGRAHV